MPRLSCRDAMEQANALFQRQKEKEGQLKVYRTARAPISLFVVSWLLLSSPPAISTLPSIRAVAVCHVRAAFRPLDF